MSCQRWWRAHRWSEWKAADVVVTSPIVQIFTHGRAGNDQVITGQARVCYRCKREELRA